MFKGCNIIVAAIILTFAQWSFHSQGAEKEDYFSYAKKRYEDFLVVKVIGANAILSDSGDICYYNYNSEIIDKIKGSYQGHSFDFFSESELPAGGDLLVQFNLDESRKFRRSSEMADPKWYNSCKEKMKGSFLIYKEISQIKEIWNGKSFEKFVELSDPDAEGSVQGHLKSVEAKVADFAFVRSELQK